MEIVIDANQTLVMENVRAYLAKEFDIREAQEREDPANRFDTRLWSGLRSLGYFDLAEDRHDVAGLVTNGIAVAYELGYGGSDSPYVPTALLAARACMASDKAWATLESLASPATVIATLVRERPPRGHAAVPWGDVATHVLATTDGALILAPVAKTTDAAPPSATRREPTARITLNASRMITLATGEAAANLRRDILDLQRTAMAAFMTGAAERAMTMAADYAKQRVQFGRPIGSFQAIQAKCANMFIAIRAARLLTFDAAWYIARGEPAEQAAWSAVISAASALRAVAPESLQTHGGIGLVENHPVQRFYRMSGYYPSVYGDRQRGLLRLAELPPAVGE
jgi:alkylation response protein AidB-like acyl-CoA dehydrogenase